METKILFYILFAVVIIIVLVALLVVPVSSFLGIRAQPPSNGHSPIVNDSVAFGANSPVSAVSNSSNISHSSGFIQIPAGVFTHSVDSLLTTNHHAQLFSDRQVSHSQTIIDVNGTIVIFTLTTTVEVQVFENSVVPASSVMPTPCQTCGGGGGGDPSYTVTGWQYQNWTDSVFGSGQSEAWGQFNFNGQGTDITGIAYANSGKWVSGAWTICTSSTVHSGASSTIGTVREDVGWAFDDCPVTDWAMAWPTVQFNTDTLSFTYASNPFTNGWTFACGCAGVSFSFPS